MKRLLVFIFILTLALSLAACGGSPANDPANPDNPATTAAGSGGYVPPVKRTPSITPAAGWEENTQSYHPMWEKETSSIQLSVDVIPLDEAPTPEAYVEFAQGKLKNSFPEAVFSETKQAKAGGMDALEYTYTITTWGMQLTLRTLYVCRDYYAYTITCSAMDYGAASADFQRMIDSFTLE